MEVLCERKAGAGTDSMFIIGMLLQKDICPGLEFANYEEKRDFACFWYLLCLFHDKAKQASMNPQTENSYYRENLTFHQVHQNLERWNLKYSENWEKLGVTFVPDSTYGSSGICFTNGTTLKESEISHSQLLDFYHYYQVCRISDGPDHGLLGGLLLYDTLVKCSLRKFADDITSRELENLYSYLSNCLIVHNMKKKIFGPDFVPFQHLSFTDNPMLFLLILSEALEPIRFFTEYGMPDEVILSSYYCMIESGKLILVLDRVLPDFEKFAQMLTEELACTKVHVSWDVKERKIVVDMNEDK